MGFSEDSKVDVEEIDETDVNWKLLKELKYTGKTDLFVTELPMDTDFASVPKVFVWFLPRYGRYTKAAILHDYLWRKAVPEGRITRLQADALFRRAMRDLHVAFLRRWIMWAAVRWGALTKPDARKDWWKESWRVVLVTLVALPIVLPPAVLIVIALLLFYLLELLFWVPLRIAHAIRPRKNVNLPRFRLKLG